MIYYILNDYCTDLGELVSETKETVTLRPYQSAKAITIPRGRIITGEQHSKYYPCMLRESGGSQATVYSVLGIIKK